MSRSRFQLVKTRETTLRGCDVHVLDTISDCTKVRSRYRRIESIVKEMDQAGEVSQHSSC